jgi:hypothetical protein
MLPSPSTAELPIQEATLELIRWFIPILHRLPRLHRHGLGDRLVANLYELLEQLALARFQRERLAILEPLRGRIQLIQLQTLRARQPLDQRHRPPAQRLARAAAARRLLGLDPRNCPSAYRNHNQPDNANNNVGFRVVCLPQHPSSTDPLEGIPAGDQEGSRPAPVIGRLRRLITGAPSFSPLP